MISSKDVPIYCLFLIFYYYDIVFNIITPVLYLTSDNNVNIYFDNNNFTINYFCYYDIYNSEEICSDFDMEECLNDDIGFNCVRSLKIDKKYLNNIILKDYFYDFSEKEVRKYHRTPCSDDNVKYNSLFTELNKNTEYTGNNDDSCNKRITSFNKRSCSQSDSGNYFTVSPNCDKKVTFEYKRPALTIIWLIYLVLNITSLIYSNIKGFNFTIKNILVFKNTLKYLPENDKETIELFVDDIFTIFITIIFYWTSSIHGGSRISNNPLILNNILSSLFSVLLWVLNRIRKTNVSNDKVSV